MNATICTTHNRTDHAYVFVDILCVCSVGLGFLFVFCCYYDSIAFRWRLSRYPLESPPLQPTLQSENLSKPTDSATHAF